MEDLDYADDLALTSEGVDKTQEKIGRLVRKAKKVGLNVNVRKMKILRLNCPDNRKIFIREEELEEVIWAAF